MYRHIQPPAAFPTQRFCSVRRGGWEGKSKTRGRVGEERRQQMGGGHRTRGPLRSQLSSSPQEGKLDPGGGVSRREAAIEQQGEAPHPPFPPPQPHTWCSGLWGWGEQPQPHSSHRAGQRGSHRCSGRGAPSAARCRMALIKAVPVALLRVVLQLSPHAAHPIQQHWGAVVSVCGVERGGDKGNGHRGHIPSTVLPSAWGRAGSAAGLPGLPIGL